MFLLLSVRFIFLRAGGGDVKIVLEKVYDNLSFEICTTSCLVYGSKLQCESKIFKTFPDGEKLKKKKIHIYGLFLNGFRVYNFQTP